MLDLASTVPAILLSLVLVVSGLAKVRDVASVRESFTTLRLPPRLSRSKAPALLPWGELVLAVALLVLSGSAAVFAAVAALALFGAYLAIIVRAVGFEEPVECGCLGRLGLGVVGPVTVVRNVLLVLLAAWTVIDASTGTSVIARWRAAEPAGWAWLGALVATLGVAALMVYAGRGDTNATSTASGSVETVQPGAGYPGARPSAAGRPDGADDYERTRIPYLPLTDPNGDVTTLRNLASTRARLLVYINPGCGACLPALEAVPGIRARAPQLGIHLVFYRAEDARSPYVTPDALGDEWFIDPQAVFVNSMEMASPAAVLLGADGYLAGGPVVGAESVKAFFDDIAAVLADDTADAQAPTAPRRTT